MNLKNHLARPLLTLLAAGSAHAQQSLTTARMGRGRRQPLPLTLRHPRSDIHLISNKQNNKTMKPTETKPPLLQSIVSRNFSSLPTLLAKVMLMFGLAAGSARAAVVLDLQMTHLRDGAGYSTGDEVTYSFILSPAAAAGTTSTSFGKTSTSWSDGLIFDSVSGTGLSGTFTAVAGTEDDSLSFRSDGLFSLYVWSRTDAYMNGLGANGIEISAYFGTPGNSLSFDSSETDATTYFSSRLGTYLPSAQSGVDLYATGASTFGLQVNSLTVSLAPVPEPGSLMLCAVALGGSVFRRSRPRRSQVAA